MKTNTLIIGSSSGIGLEATNFFLKKGHNVIGISRRGNNINSNKFRNIKFDLTDFENYDLLFSRNVQCTVFAGLPRRIVTISAPFAKESLGRI